MVFQEVMRNKLLAPESKAIYAYLASFAGSNDTCYPTKDLMCSELCMSENRLSKYIKQLVELGVIEVNRQKRGGLKANNEYKIIHSIRYIENRGIENRGIENRGIENTEVENRGIENMGTNINNFNNNNLNNNSIKNNNAVSGETDTTAQRQKPTKHKYGEYNNVLLTDEELEKLKEEYCDYETRIERLSSYVASTGKKYKSHYATIRNWARKERENQTINTYHKQTKAEELDDFYKMAHGWAKEGDQ